MKTRFVLCALAVWAISAAPFCAAEVAAPAGAEMSLSLYQTFKAHFDALYGAQASLLPGTQGPNKKDVEQALRADASANKDALIAALDSPKQIHRELAARALEYCGDKAAAVPALGRSVQKDEDEFVRRAAAAALAKLADAAAVEALIAGLSDSVDGVRGLCATALGNIKDSRASEGLLRILAQDSKPLVRLQAAVALSKVNDPKTKEPLQQALQSETDERVKMAIAGALRKIVGGDNANTADMPRADEAARELLSLAKEMKDVEGKLRDDRHDMGVQVQGQGIEKRLTTLIERISKASSSSSGSCNKPQQQQGQQQQAGNQQNNGKSGGSPLQSSKLGSAVPPGASNPALVAGTQDSWAKLPPAQRDELLQAYRDGMPLRWQKRLEAYFYSIANEEAKRMEEP